MNEKALVHIVLAGQPPTDSTVSMDLGAYLALKNAGWNAPLSRYAVRKDGSA